MAHSVCYWAYRWSVPMAEFDWNGASFHSASQYTDGNNWWFAGWIWNAIRFGLYQRSWGLRDIPHFSQIPCFNYDFHGFRDCDGRNYQHGEGLEMQKLTALLAGLIFGLGLVVSQMTNPAKVISFLDVFGDWDPSLALVMFAALIVTGIGYRVVLKRDEPVFADRFQLPTRTELDARLIAGAALFGVGWGLVGLCPGPAIADLAVGGLPILIFLASMAAGMAVFEGFDRLSKPSVTKAS